jgi:uncharacterized membrane protein YphA (DoxX/SURF4 family)
VNASYSLKGTPTHAPEHGALVGTAFRIVLGVVLFIAGALKITDLGQSAVAVKAYRLFPEPIQAEIVGYALPPFEMLLGTLLILGLFTRVAATGAAILMVVFIAGIISVWVRDISIECVCFNAGGALDSPVNPYEYGREIFRDVVLLFLAGWLIVWPRTRWALDTIARPHLHKVYDLMLDDEEFDDENENENDDDSVGRDTASDDSPRAAEEPAR